jgi:integrase
MAKTLTAITCRNAKPGAKRREMPDSGCRGLYFIIQPSGVKSWAARYRFRGMTRKLTLGSFLDNGGQEPGIEPELDTPLSLASARELCTRALRQAKSGVDPTALKRKRRTAQRAGEADTLTAVTQEFLRRKEPQRADGQLRSDLELLCQALGRLPVIEIRRGQFARAFDTIADTRGPVRADRVRSSLNRALNWHAGRSDYVNVLGRGGRRTSTAERARSRVLSDDELRRVWTTAERIKGPFASFVQFTLLTATRRGESAGLRRDELSGDGKTWIIPAARYKSKRDTLIPLSGAAKRIVAAQPHIGDFVFSTTGRRPLTDFAKHKTAFDKASGVTGWVIHDLRRSGRTLLSRAGVSSDVAERCLGHVMGGVRGVYDRHEYEPEKRHAFEALAAQIEKIVHPPAAKIADMGEARAKRRARR